MFTFALAFFAGHRYFSLHFQPLSAFRWKRKKEFGRKHLQRKPRTTTTTCVRHRVLKLIAFLALQYTFHLFRKKMHFKVLKKTINRKTEFPDFSRTLTISKIFADFLTNSLTFPWPWKLFVFPRLFPDSGNATGFCLREATAVLGLT